MVEVTRDAAGTRVYVAGLLRRTIAALIDLVCLSPVLGLAGWVAFKVAGLPLATGKGFRPEMVLELFLWGGLPFYGVLALALGLTLLYAFIFIAVTGNTPGLLALRLRVINAYGERPEWWRVLIRCIGQIIGLAALGVGLLWIGVSRHKRGLHDLLAGTYVVRARSAQA